MIKTRHMHFPGLLFFPYPVLAFMTLNLVPLGTSAFSSQSTDVPTDHSTEDWGLSALIVHVNQSLNFDASDGQLVVVPVGAYLAEPILQSEPRLILWHEHGTITLQATQTTHDQPVETPVAYLIREDDHQDIHHVVVFLPDGTALECTGSISGFKSGEISVSQDTTTSILLRESSSLEMDDKVAGFRQVNRLFPHNFGMDRVVRIVK